MMYQDKYGNLLLEDQIDELSEWEIEELEVHVAMNPEYWCFTDV